MEQLEIIATDIDGVRVVTPAGQVDLATAPRLRESLLTHLTDHPNVLVIRLDLVSFLDPWGVGAFVAAYRQAAAQGTELRLAAAGEAVDAVLRRTGVDELIPTFVSLKEARSVDTPAVPAYA